MMPRFQRLVAIGRCVTVDLAGNAYVAGESAAAWGSPTRPRGIGVDAYAARLSSTGALSWNTFLSGSGSDYGFGDAVDDLEGPRGGPHVCHLGRRSVSIPAGAMRTCPKRIQRPFSTFLSSAGRETFAAANVRGWGALTVHSNRRRSL